MKLQDQERKEVNLKRPVNIIEIISKSLVIDNCNSEDLRILVLLIEANVVKDKRLVSKALVSNTDTSFSFYDSRRPIDKQFTLAEVKYPRIET